LPRKPHKSSEDAKMMASPIKTNPVVTRASWPGAALYPPAVIGDSAAVPRMAAAVVTTQLPYVPLSSAQ
jgi:hypothetical protein